MTTPPEAEPIELPPIEVPRGALVLLIGARGAGKTTFALRCFGPTEGVSEARLRAAVCDRERDPSAAAAAWALLEQIVDERLRRHLLTCVDAELLDSATWSPLVRLARRRHAPVVALGLRLSPETCLERLVLEPGELRVTAAAEVREQASRQVPAALAELRRRRDVTVHELTSAQLDRPALRVVPRPCDRSDLAGPFDLIGDVYRLDGDRGHPDGRTAVFLGDLADRGPRSVAVLTRVMDMAAAGHALCVLGNHDDKLRRWLEGRKVQVSHGLQRTVAEIEGLPGPERAAFVARAHAFLTGLTSHLVLAGGRLVAAHGGIRADMIGGVGPAVEAFTRYGAPTGETRDGLPVRADWAADYQGEAFVVYGHTPQRDPEWRNRTVCVDQGCCYGGRLTALRWPEGRFVQVLARRTYVPPRGGFRPRSLAPPEAPDPALPVDAT